MAESRTRAMIRPAEPEQSRKSRRGTRFVDGAVEAAHAQPTDPSPQGDLRAASSQDICRISSAVWDDWRTESGRREAGIGRLLEHLTLFPGEDWQQRWLASGLDTYGQPVHSRFRTKHTAWSAGAGAEALFCLRVIRPSLEGLRTNRFTAYPETFRVAQADPGLDEMFTYAATLDMSRPNFLRLLNDICAALTVQEIAFKDLTRSRLPPTPSIPGSCRCPGTNAGSPGIWPGNPCARSAISRSRLPAR